MTKIQSETKPTFVGPNTEKWSLGRTNRRVGGQLDVENKPVLAELVRQKQIVDKLLKDPKMVAFLEANPDLKLENLLDSTNFKAADGKTYDIRNIL
ncbi:MAG: hypothetical protein GYA55_09570, partial [SAR324 cluster bacterium]|nr:hypothetical protein [SAR324 cluster bacterium]